MLFDNNQLLSILIIRNESCSEIEECQQFLISEDKSLGIDLENFDDGDESVVREHVEYENQFT